MPRRVLREADSEDDYGSESERDSEVEYQSEPSSTRPQRMVITEYRSHNQATTTNFAPVLALSAPIPTRKRIAPAKFHIHFVVGDEVLSTCTATKIAHPIYRQTMIRSLDEELALLSEEDEDEDQDQDDKEGQAEEEADGIIGKGKLGSTHKKDGKRNPIRSSVDSEVETEPEGSTPSLTRRTRQQAMMTDNLGHNEVNRDDEEDEDDDDDDNNNENRKLPFRRGHAHETINSRSRLGTRSTTSTTTSTTTNSFPRRRSRQADDDFEEEEEEEDDEDEEDEEEEDNHGISRQSLRRRSDLRDRTQTIRGRKDRSIGHKQDSKIPTTRRSTRANTNRRTRGSDGFRSSSTPSRRRSFGSSEDENEEQEQEEDEDNEDVDEDDEEEDDDNLGRSSQDRRNSRNSRNSRSFGTKRSEKVSQRSRRTLTSDGEDDDENEKDHAIGSRGRHERSSTTKSSSSRGTLKSEAHKGRTGTVFTEEPTNDTSSDEEGDGDEGGKRGNFDENTSGRNSTSSAAATAAAAATAFSSYPAMPISSAPALAAAVSATLSFPDASETSPGARLNADVDTVNPSAGGTPGSTSAGSSDSLDFSQVGGLDSHLRTLHEMVVLPLLHPEVFQAHGIVPPRGVLFTGPPGTGKTLTARALAATCSRLSGKEVSFFVRKGADCLSKWVGEAERQLRLLFSEARARQPSVIFFDEIDGLAPVRSARQDQAHASLVSTLLALMDGLDSRGQVIIIGATNRVDAIDPALRRPGRFDRELLFALPSPLGREQILKIHTRSWPYPPRGPLLAELVRQTAGYCGADLRSLCTEASLRRVRKKLPHLYDLTALKTGVMGDMKAPVSTGPLIVTREDFMDALKAVVPASHRAVASPAVPLPFPLDILLGRELTRLVAVADSIFPRSQGKSKRQDLESESEGENKITHVVESDMSTHKMLDSNTIDKNIDNNVTTLVSSAVADLCEKYSRPRLLIHGSAGLGQSSLAAALLREYESLPLFTLHLPTLLVDSAVSAGGLEAAVVQVISEARKNAPSVLFWPNVDRWWAAISPTARAVALIALHELPSDSGVFLLGHSEEHFNVLPASLQSIFVGDRAVETFSLGLTSSGEENRDTSVDFTTLDLLPEFQKKNLYDLEASYKTGSLNYTGFFAPALSLLVAPQLIHSKRGKKTNSLNSLTGTGNDKTTQMNSNSTATGDVTSTSLALVPASTSASTSFSTNAAVTDTSITSVTSTTSVTSATSATSTPSLSLGEAQIIQQRTNDEILLLHLRMFLRSVVSTLLRNYRDFVMLPDEDSTYGVRVPRPMFLLDTLAKVNDTSYLSVREFLLDIDLITANTQRAYSLGTAHGRSLIARACDMQDTALSLCLGLDRNMALACEVMSARLRAEARLCGKDFTPWASLLFAPDPKLLNYPPLTVAAKVNADVTQREIQRLQAISSMDSTVHAATPISSQHMSDKKEASSYENPVVDKGTSDPNILHVSTKNSTGIEESSSLVKPLPTTSSLSCFDSTLSSSSFAPGHELTDQDFVYPEIDVRLLKILFHGIESKVSQVWDIDQLENLFATLFSHARAVKNEVNKNKAVMAMIVDVKSFLKSCKRQKNVQDIFEKTLIRQQQQSSEKGKDMEKVQSSMFDVFSGLKNVKTKGKQNNETSQDTIVTKTELGEFNTPNDETAKKVGVVDIVDMVNQAKEAKNTKNTKSTKELQSNTSFLGHENTCRVPPSTISTPSKRSSSIIPTSTSDSNSTVTPSKYVFPPGYENLSKAERKAIKRKLRESQNISGQSTDDDSGSSHDGKKRKLL